MASNDDSDRREQEIGRYRRAAEETLDQLEWCINYLHRIRKSGLANALAKNRSTIRRQMSATDD